MTNETKKLKGVKELKEDLLSIAKEHNARRGSFGSPDIYPFVEIKNDKYFFPDTKNKWEYHIGIINSERYSNDAKRYASFLLANDSGRTEEEAKFCLESGLKTKAANIYLHVANTAHLDYEPFGLPKWTNEKRAVIEGSLEKIKEIYHDLGQSSLIDLVLSARNGQKVSPKLMEYACKKLNLENQR